MEFLARNFVTNGVDETSLNKSSLVPAHGFSSHRFESCLFGNSLTHKKRTFRGRGSFGLCAACPYIKLATGMGPTASFTTAARSLCFLLPCRGRVVCFAVSTFMRLFPLLIQFFFCICAFNFTLKLKP